MPALCSGPTEIQEGAPTLAYIGPAEVHAYYSNGSVALHYLIDHVYTGMRLVHVGDLCAEDPGTPPAITALDFLTALNPLQRPPVWDKFDWAARAFVFSQNCQCAAIPEQEVPAGCMTLDGGTVPIPFLSVGPPGNRYLGPHMPVVNDSGTGKLSVFTPTGKNVDVWIRCFNSSDVSIGIIDTAGYESDGRVNQGSLPAGTAFIAAEAQRQNDGHGAFDMTYTLEHCHTGYTEDETPAEIPTLPEPEPEPDGIPEPPDCGEPDLCDIQTDLAHLSDQIWDLRQRVNALLQQSPPAGPTTAPDQTPVEGQVTVPAAGIRGLSVEYEKPAWLGSIDGDPPIDLMVGYITLRTAEGYYPPILLQHSPQIVDPVPSGVVEVLVSLSPGVTGTVSTYEREVL